MTAVATGMTRQGTSSFTSARRRASTGASENMSFSLVMTERPTKARGRASGATSIWASAMLAA